MHGEHMATSADRVDYIEKCLGDSADRNAKELAAAHEKTNANDLSDSQESFDVGVV